MIIVCATIKSKVSIGCCSVGITGAFFHLRLSHYGNDLQTKLHISRRDGSRKDGTDDHISYQSARARRQRAVSYRRTTIDDTQLAA